MWITEREISCDMRGYLIGLFIQFRWKHPFEFNVPRLLSSLKFPPSHPKALHPALVNVILLTGCLYAEESFRRLEPVLVNRVRDGLQHSLAYADRLFDCVRASTFLGCYYYSKGRLLEGHYYASGAMSLAVACGLHTIDSLDLNTQATSSLLDPAVDLIELGDRINMFWMLFGVDRVASPLAGAIPRGPLDEYYMALSIRGL